MQTEHMRDLYEGDDGLTPHDDTHSSRHSQMMEYGRVQEIRQLGETGQKSRLKDLSISVLVQIEQ